MNNLLDIVTNYSEIIDFTRHPIVIIRDTFIKAKTIIIVDYMKIMHFSFTDHINYSIIITP